MEEVSVLIPTYRRPEMLRTALRSVMTQTAVGAIREIVVIENGPDQRSREICGEFGQLPIAYSCREHSLPPGSRENVEAGKKIMRGMKTRLMALLFDDDWWTFEHLARSLESHAGIADCVASFCTCIQTENESSYLSGLFDDYIAWFAVGGRRTAGRWVLSLPDLLVASQIANPFHYSSMLIDREVYLRCLDATDCENPYDTDRTLSVELGFHGKVVCDPFPSVFMRVHPMMESRRLDDSGEGRRWFRKSTDRIVEKARAQGLNLREEFAARLLKSGVSFEHIRKISHLQNVDYLVEIGVLDKSLHRGSRQWPYIKPIVRGLVPPWVYAGLARLARSVFAR